MRHANCGGIQTNKAMAGPVRERYLCYILPERLNETINDSK